VISLIVDFALKNRLLVLATAVLLLVWGAISFHNLPVEAYPDVANNYVQVITQWPGRAAEEVEQQVTVPLEIAVAGIPHMEHLRSTSLFGLSSLMLIFDDASSNDTNRQKVLERLSQVTLPANLQPQMGSDYSPVGQIYWYTLHSTNPAYDLMELKSIEDWVLEKQFKSVPNVVDVSSFGGTTREYQVRIDPDKLVSYALNIGQVEQQLANNNVNAGGSFVEAGSQQINVRTVGLVHDIHDIQDTLIKTQNGTAIRVGDIAEVAQGAKIRLGRIGKAIHRADGTILDNDDVVEGIVLLRKGANSDTTLDAIHAKVKELNEHILPRGVKIVPFLDRSDLVHYTTHTVLHNLTEGIILVAIILFLFLGNVRGDGGKHRPAPGAPKRIVIVDGTHPRGRARSAAPGVLLHRHHYHRIPAHLHVAAGGRPAVQAHGLDGGVCAIGCAAFLDADRARAVQFPLWPARQGVAQPGHDRHHEGLSHYRWMGHSVSLGDGGGGGCGSGCVGMVESERPDRLRIPAAPG
jgi:cobalt-zinc-cadmium resistance protein CzcA